MKQHAGRDRWATAVLLLTDGSPPFCRANVADLVILLLGCLPWTEPELHELPKDPRLFVRCTHSLAEEGRRLGVCDAAERGQVAHLLESN